LDTQLGKNLAGLANDGPMNNTPIGNRPTVLTVEDEPDIRGIIAEELSEAGFNVIQAANGEAALAMVRQYHPKVIIIDLVMPKMNGLQFLLRLAALETDNASVIVISGMTDPLITETCRGAGASLIMDKPFHLDDLRIAVINAIANNPC